MSEISEDDVIAVFGKVSDAVAAEIIATGASKDQMGAARDRYILDHKTRSPGAARDPGPVAQSVERLERSRHGLLGEAGSTLR
jgi:hypothetical protein